VDILDRVSVQARDPLASAQMERLWMGGERLTAVPVAVDPGGKGRSVPNTKAAEEELAVVVGVGNQNVVLLDTTCRPTPATSQAPRPRPTRAFPPAVQHQNDTDN
jgi:hypothetical protein